MASKFPSPLTPNPNASRKQKIYVLMRERYPRYVVPERNRDIVLEHGTEEKIFVPEGDYEQKANQTPQSVKDMLAEKASKYFDELTSLSDGELSDRVKLLIQQKVDAQEERIKRALNLITLTKERCLYWAKFDTWTIQQAVDLLHGFEPHSTADVRKLYPAKRKKSYSAVGSEIANAMSDTEELLMNNLHSLAEKGLLKVVGSTVYIYPSAAILWATEKERPASELLRDAIANLAADITTEIYASQEFERHKCGSIPVNVNFENWPIQIAIHWVATFHKRECRREEYAAAAQILLEAMGLNPGEFNATGIGPKEKREPIENYWESTIVSPETLTSILSENGAELNPFSGTFQTPEGEEYLKVSVSSGAVVKAFPVRAPFEQPIAENTQLTKKPGRGKGVGSHNYDAPIEAVHAGILAGDFKSPSDGAKQLGEQYWQEVGAISIEAFIKRLPEKYYEKYPKQT